MSTRICFMRYTVGERNSTTPLYSRSRPKRKPLAKVDTMKSMMTARKWKMKYSAGMANILPVTKATAVAEEK